MEYLAPESFTLKKALTVSFLTHLVIIIIFLFRPYLFPSARTFKASVYRVNLVSLPPPPSKPAPAPAVAGKTSRSSSPSPAKSGTRVVKKSRAR